MHLLLYATIYVFAAASFGVYAVRTLVELPANRRWGATLFLVVWSASGALMGYVNHWGPAGVALGHGVMVLSIVVGTSGHPARLYLAMFTLGNPPMPGRAKLRLLVTIVLFIAFVSPVLMRMRDKHL